MDLKRLAEEIKAGEWRDAIAPHAASDTLKFSVDEIHDLLIQACAFDGGAVVQNAWFDIYWTASWVNAMLGAGIRPASTVVEIGSGMSSNVIRAANALLGSRGRYIGVNLNRILCEEFRERSRHLPIRLRFIEDDAANVQQHMPHESCSFIAFNHQVNDILQTVAFEAAGHRTDHIDWFERLAEMIRLVNEASQSGEIETAIRPKFLQIIRSCAAVLHSGGVMGFNNAITAMLLRMGYSEDLLGSYIPLARRWILEEFDDWKELELPGYHRKWWLIVRKP